MQLDLLVRPVVRPSVSAKKIVVDTLAQRSCWTFRGFRLAIESCLERNGIPKVALEAELDLCGGHVSRACGGHHNGAVFTLAEKLGYSFTGPRDEGAVFKIINRREAA